MTGGETGLDRHSVFCRRRCGVVRTGPLCATPRCASESSIRPGTAGPFSSGPPPHSPTRGSSKGEFLARRGEHEGAQTLFEQSTQHGLPLFSDGLGYLSSRIPQYLRLMAAATRDATTVHQQTRQQLFTAWGRLRPFVGVADLKPVLLTLRGNELRYAK